MRQSYLLILFILFCGFKDPSIQHKEMINLVNNMNNEGLIKIIEFKYDECDQECFLESKIISQIFKYNNYELIIGAYLNCAGNFGGEIGIINDTLKLEVLPKPNENGIVEYVTCDCYYQMQFIIEGIKSLPKEITINGETLDLNYKNRGPIIEE